MTYIFAVPIIIALAVIASLVSSQFRRRQAEGEGGHSGAMLGVYKNTSRAIAAGLIVILLIVTAARSLNKADSGEVAIVYNFGAITSQRDEGLFLVWPWQDVKTLNLRTQTYTNAQQGNDGQFAAGGIGAFTAEGQDVFLRLTINYVVQATNVQKLVREHGINYYDRVRVEARILQTVKEITPEYTTIDIKDSRLAIADKIKVRLSQQFAPLYLDVTSVAIDNFFFSDDYQAAINRKAIVEQEALAAIN
ncbi:MAG: SPFH domain-containing protein, partial [Dehalococcoidia bacterium]